jgi:D-erythro-7,8-dihydroneopterin triphosphate epimerase
MDIIRIQDLSLRTIIGIYPEERREKQDVLFNIALHADLRKAGKSDDLRDTVDYKALKQEIIRRVEASSFNLIEALAESVAQLCLKNRKIARVQVSVDKPGALRFARSVSVTVDRKRL